MPGLVPGIHGVPLERMSLLNSRLFPQSANLSHLSGTQGVIAERRTLVFQ